jgi:hypothetical protein
MSEVAPKVTYFGGINAASGDQTVESGFSIKVYGIKVADAGAAAVRVDFKTSTAVPGRPAGTVFHSLSIVANGSDGCDIPFLADAGIVVDVLSGDADVTIFHSNYGA